MYGQIAQSEKPVGPSQGERVKLPGGRVRPTSGGVGGEGKTTRRAGWGRLSYRTQEIH